MHTEAKPGDILDGKYRVERVLGTGGMGTVVAAQHLKLDQKVAIKFLHAEALTHDHVVKRFASEARAAAKIKSQHVARVIDVGEFENGAPFMVMEHLDGNDLSDELKKRGALPISEAILYIIQACDALAEAHSLGIVHRDLKPANLFLTRSAGGAPITKVLDFGISKTTVDASGERGLTSTQMVMGTPHYMSPEQIRSTRDVDARSDIWALGVIIFELLTDNLPFDGDNSTAIIASIISEAPRPITSLNPEVPGELERVIARAMHRDKAQRFQNVGELSRALLPFTIPGAASIVSNISRVIGGAQETERPRPAPVAATQTAYDPNKTAFDPQASAIAAASVQGTEANFGTTQFTHQSRGSRTFGIVAGLGVLALLGGLATWRLSASTSSPEPGVAAGSSKPEVTSAAAVAVPPKSQSNPARSAEPHVEPVVPLAAAPQVVPVTAAVAEVAASKPVAQQPTAPVVSSQVPPVAHRKNASKKNEKKAAEAKAEAPPANSEKPKAKEASVSGNGLLHMGLK
ncbi:MAG: protein kinase [Polyangiaceae bacterium]|nr:protein kinase [Polyangiaceae bacterium]